MLTAVYSPGEKVPSRTVLTFIPIGAEESYVVKEKREKKSSSLKSK
jgi:hypothetical protein